MSVAQSEGDVTMQAEAPIGEATMKADRTIVLDLQAELPGGGYGHARLEYPPGHEQYREILDHVGPLAPGETRLVPPWPIS